MTPLDIVYEDNHLLAINKAPGVLVQGDETGDQPLVDAAKKYIKDKYNKPGEVFLGVVHRLDRPVSGIVVFARTSKALARMNELFRNRKTEKVYWALTDSPPPTRGDQLVHWLKKDEKKNKTTTYVRETPGALKAALTYKLMGTSGGRHLVEVRPITGRSHQIRAQLSAIGCAILGDAKYGSAVQTGDGSIALHARRLKFIHPVRKETVDLAVLPPEVDWWIPFRNK